MSHRAFTVILHTLSQLQGRWLPPLIYAAKAPTLGSPIDINIESPLDAVSWTEFVAWALRPEGALAWTASYVQRLPGGVRQIAAAAYQHLNACQDAGARYVLFGDDDYPSWLATIARPPLGLSLLGDRNALQPVNIAVVGSRKASPRGLRDAFALGQLLADLGFCVVSGGAFGCDVAAHRGCLASARAPMPAAIVFAGGLGHQYPRANAHVFREIKERGGLLISEKLWHQSARRMDFPIRNRIVSGLACATVLVEAAETSGALITAHAALDQGREVFVLRPAAEDVRAAGNKKLIQDGARHVATVEELACLIVDLTNISSSAQEGFTVC